MRDSDTIFALATPPGRSAIAVVRLSGEDALAVLAQVTRGEFPEARRASLRGIYAPGSDEKIDDAVVTIFEAPASYTGEHCIEISLHGSRGIVAALCAGLTQLGGVRPAKPGEFTQRAFLNGRLDLTQAEAVADLIDSETEHQRRQALRVLGGSLGEKLDSWRSRLVQISAEIESGLDFSDEGDVERSARLELIYNCATLRSEIDFELAAGARSRRLRDGFTVVIAGPPNAGKSALFNTLVGRETAIVTELAGTTRDLNVGALDLDGSPVILVDTAGLRDTLDPIERIGIERARQSVQSADLVLWISAHGEPFQPSPAFPVETLVVRSKCDLSSENGDWLNVSILRPETCNTLRDAIRDRAIQGVGDGSEGSLIRERHKTSLEACSAAVSSIARNSGNSLIELAAEDCRVALAALDEIRGRTTTEDILGEIFGRFCIGK